VHEATAEALMKDPAVQKAYLGSGGASAPRTHRGDTPASATPAQPSRPRAPAQSPAAIAAAAMQQFARTPAAPEPPRPAAPPPPVPPAAPTAAKQPSPGGIDLDSLVSRARQSSAAAVSTRRPNGPNGATPPAPRPPATPMPDLGNSADRLRAALREIEEAAARAQAYRPPNRKP
jgi:branched-chain amino acid transport system ATP-binding protein